jgi:hypothetical protein
MSILDYPKTQTRERRIDAIVVSRLINVEILQHTFRVLLIGLHIRIRTPFIAITALCIRRSTAT